VERGAGRLNVHGDVWNAFHRNRQSQIRFHSFLVSHLPWRACFEASFPPLYLSLLGYRLLIGHRGEVKGMGIAFQGFLCGNVFVSITLVSTPILIFSSWVQLSDCTCARGRSEELLQLFLSRETYADVGACPEGKSLVLVFVIS